ncbi:MAG TPA: hypothetical protein VFG62_05415, partial [Rhodopila sp.]|nr:hypothetical protein [Rhodopila sp.]
MRRIAKWFGIALLVLLCLPVLTAAIAVGLANTDYGRHLIERETPALTAGMVRLDGLAGRFPDALRVGRIEVADSKGTYVTLTGVVLDWSPTALVKGIVRVDQVSAQTLDLSRLPVSDTKTKSSSGSYSLPVQVELKRLAIDKVSIGAPVAGTAADLSLTGSGDLRTLTDGTIHLAAKRLDQAGQYDVDASLNGADIGANVSVQEPPKGLIATIAKLPDLGAVSIKAEVKGPQ